LQAEGYGSSCLRYGEERGKSGSFELRVFFGCVEEQFARVGVRKNPRFALNAPIFSDWKNEVDLEK
jgi:hypothetical protein